MACTREITKVGRAFTPEGGYGERYEYPAICGLPNLPGHEFCWYHAPADYEFSAEEISALEDWAEGDYGCGAPTGAPDEKWLEAHR